MTKKILTPGTLVSLKIICMRNHSWSIVEIQNLRSAMDGENVKSWQFQHCVWRYIYIYIYIHTHTQWNFNYWTTLKSNNLEFDQNILSKKCLSDQTNVRSWNMSRANENRTCVNDYQGKSYTDEWLAKSIQQYCLSF